MSSEDFNAAPGLRYGFDVVRIEAALALQLEFYEHPLADDLKRVLAGGNIFINSLDVVEAADIRLQQYAEEVAEKSHQAVVDRVLLTYPEEYSEDGLISPRQYSKAHNIENRRR